MTSLRTQNPKCDHQQREQTSLKTQGRGPCNFTLACIKAWFTPEKQSLLATLGLECFLWHHWTGKSSPVDGPGTSLHTWARHLTSWKLDQKAGQNHRPLFCKLSSQQTFFTPKTTVRKRHMINLRAHVLTCTVIFLGQGRSTFSGIKSQINYYQINVNLKNYSKLCFQSFTSYLAVTSCSCIFSMGKKRTLP